jgi:DNA transformation protein and related proteins
MNEITKLPNIGKTLAEKLIMVGITNEQKLKEVGSENAIIKISTIDNNDVCINMLYALEGAIQGIRWHNLDTYRKMELKEFFYQLKK